VAEEGAGPPGSHEMFVLHTRKEAHAEKVAARAYMIQP
jgi:hypothetical protein